MSADNLFTVGNPNDISFPSLQPLSEQIDEVDTSQTKNNDPIQEAKELNRILFVYKCEIEATCNICLSEINGKNAEITPCGHIYHAKCLIRWKNIQNKNTCPVCRAQLKKPKNVDLEELSIESQLVRLELNDLIRSQFLRLPPAPFAIQLDTHVSITFCFDINPNNCSIDILQQIAEWVQVMGVRISSLDFIEEALSNRTETPSSFRRPGGMEILTFEEIGSNTENLGMSVSISYVGITAPDLLAHGRDALSNLSPFQPGIPLATISSNSDGHFVSSSHIAQAGCILMACEPELLTRHFYTGNGLGFGNPQECANNFPNTVSSNTGVTFDIQSLLSCMESVIPL